MNHQLITENTMIVITFSRPHPTMQLQQKRCPHSVAVLDVRSSRQSVQLRLSRSCSATDFTLRAVCSSSSAEVGGDESSGAFARIVTIGTSSSLASELDPTENFPFSPSASCTGLLEGDVRRSETSRCMSLITIKTPSKEYDGGRTFGFSGIDDIYANTLIVILLEIYLYGLI